MKIPSLFKKNKLPGLLLQKEIFELNKVLNSKKPKLAVIGGAKISTKVSLINKLLYTCDDIIIGGAMAFSFIKHLLSEHLMISSPFLNLRYTKSEVSDTVIEQIGCS